jgi:hypothetical protein
MIDGMLKLKDVAFNNAHVAFGRCAANDLGLILRVPGAAWPAVAGISKRFQPQMLAFVSSKPDPHNPEIE